MTGAGHSHNPEYPDDSWNLYAMLDTNLTTALNATNSTDALGVFKPFARRLETNPQLISDADEELMIVAQFTSPVHIRKIMIIGGGENDKHPSQLKCYVNKDNIDFSSVQSLTPSQAFNLPVNSDGTVELMTVLRPFTNVNSVVFFFPANHGGGDQTIIKYIGMQGEHTHYRRIAVDAVYEVLCNGQDLECHDDELGAQAQHMH